MQFEGERARLRRGSAAVALKLAVNVLSTFGVSPSSRTPFDVDPAFAAPECSSATSAPVAWLRMVPLFKARLSIGTSSDVCEPSASVSV